MTAIYAIILFVLLIFPHELGHFMVAKAVGVKVNEFAFGMGPALYQREKGETLYSVRLIPIGGYCAMEGENEDSENPRAFNNKPGWAKLSILFAGAAMNILIAVLVLSITMGIIGGTTTTIAQVDPSRPAYEAGLQPGDEIVAINGEKIGSWGDLSAYINDDKTPIDIAVERNGQEVTATMVPVEVDGQYLIGITSKVTHNPVVALKNGIITTWNMTVLMLDTFRMLVTGAVPATEIAGPVGIVSMVNDASSYGWYSFATLLALMSINLAILNLLPLPALDGGRILFVIIRKITGKMISDQMEGTIHTIGMALLIGLMVFATWNDIVRLFT